jgi:CheY-like chemotaxis protein
MMDWLIVEDDTPKQERILSFIHENWPGGNVRTARSVRAAIKEVYENKPDLMLLDMSLPTFDVGPNEPGGRPQNFGGVEVLRYMDLYQVPVPTIVITAYEVFSKDGRAINHDALDDELSREHPDSYRGLIYYNSLFAEWKAVLSGLITRQMSGDDP